METKHVGYYYLHTNGKLIYKRFRPEQEPGGFVEHVWRIDTSQRSDAWDIVIEGLALGANKERVEELVEAWELTLEDATQYLVRNPDPSELQQKGFRMYLEDIQGVDADEWWSWLEEQGTADPDELDFASMPTGDG